MDQIRIDNLEVYAYHGVFPEEKEKGQPFFLNVVLYVDTRKAGKTDELTDSIHYGEASHLLHDWMREKSYDLLEAVTEEMAARLLHRYPTLQGVELEVRKPQAPIGLPFESVSVKIHRQWHRVYLSMGSNMGDKEGYLRGALEGLRGTREIRGVESSSFLVTRPYGGVEQEDFLNAAVKLETTLEPGELLERLHELEAAACRERKIRWGPRTLDLDLLFYDKLVYEDEALIIPHVDLQNREFVLEPLCQLAPWLRHPLLGRTMEELLRELRGGQGVGTGQGLSAGASGEVP